MRKMSCATSRASRRFLALAFYELGEALAAILVGRVGVERAFSDGDIARPDVSIEGTGLDQHDSDAEGVGFNAKRFAEAFEGVLGAAIGAEQRGADAAGDGRDLDDVSGFLTAHHGQYGLAHGDGGKEVGFELMAVFG